MDDSLCIDLNVVAAETAEASSTDVDETVVAPGGRNRNGPPTRTTGPIPTPACPELRGQP